MKRMAHRVEAERRQNLRLVLELIVFFAALLLVGLLLSLDDPSPALYIVTH